MNTVPRLGTSVITLIMESSSVLAASLNSLDFSIRARASANHSGDRYWAGTTAASRCKRLNRLEPEKKIRANEPRRSKAIYQTPSSATPVNFMKEQTEVRTLREGRYVLIDDFPCKIVSIDTSKPGKHGSAKANITAIDIFTGTKRTLQAPVSEKVFVPQID